MSNIEARRQTIIADGRNPTPLPLTLREAGGKASNYKRKGHEFSINLGRRVEE